MDLDPFKIGGYVDLGLFKTKGRMCMYMCISIYAHIYIHINICLVVTGAKYSCMDCEITFMECSYISFTLYGRDVLKIKREKL